MYHSDENFSNFIYKYDTFKKNKDEIKNLEELEDLQSKVKQVKLVGKLGEQAYYYDI